MKKIKLGDVFKIDTPKGKAYLHYVYEDERLGSLLRVLEGLYTEEFNNLEEITNTKEKYLLFFPLKSAYKKDIVQLVGFLQCDDFVKPKEMRTEHNVRGEFLGWHIVNTETWQMEYVKELNNEQKKLSDWGIWNDTLLIERLVNKWDLDSWS